jgi:hypothetical protein
MALSISFLSPIFSVPVAFLTRKMASLIFRPDLRFLAVTLLQSRTRPNFSLGSSSLISLRRQSFSVSRARFRPPGNIHSRSRLRRTRRTLPRFTATSFDDFAIGPNSTRVGSDRLVTTEPHFTAPKMSAGDSKAGSDRDLVPRTGSHRCRRFRCAQSSSHYCVGGT